MLPDASWRAIFRNSPIPNSPKSHQGHQASHLRHSTTHLFHLVTPFPTRRMLRLRGLLQRRGGAGDPRGAADLRAPGGRRPGSGHEFPAAWDVKEVDGRSNSGAKSVKPGGCFLVVLTMFYYGFWEKEMGSNWHGGWMGFHLHVAKRCRLRREWLHAFPQSSGSCSLFFCPRVAHLEHLESRFLAMLPSGSTHKFNVFFSNAPV